MKFFDLLKNLFKKKEEEPRKEITLLEIINGTLKIQAKPTKPNFYMYETKEETYLFRIYEEEGRCSASYFNKKHQPFRFNFKFNDKMSFLGSIETFKELVNEVIEGLR
jgi:hypothetical protein